MTTPDAGGTAAGVSPPQQPGMVTVAWTGDNAFRSTSRGGAVLTLDGNAKLAQSPAEALLSALAGCTAVDIVEILRKRRTPADTLEIRVLGTRANGTPRRFTDIVLEYAIAGAGIDRAPAERAVDLAVNKYCTVKDSLAKDIVFTWRLVLNGEPGADHDASAR